VEKFTKSIRKEDVKREWIVLDATDETFGRLISKTAHILRGKHKPTFTPNVDCGDYVVIVNASKVKFNGNNKMTDKKYHRHSGYFGSTKSETLAELLDKNPEKLYKLATRGMLPKTKLGKEMLKKLKVYEGAEHPHTAQVGKEG
jgi:large subunit ribosomal protein L13